MPAERGILPALRQHVKHRLRGAREPRPVHFLHIGKTGGTAIKFAINEAQSGETPFPIHLHPHRFVLRDVPEGESFMFCLRDPVTRFVSAFYSRQREGRPRYPGRWTPEEGEAFGRFKTAGALALALSSSDPEEAQFAHAAMRNIGHVRNGYWTWFENEEYFRSRERDLFFIGFQERLADDFEILKSKLGLPRHLALPGDDVQAHVNPRGLDRTLRDEAVANLHRWYAADFRFVDLCHELIQENPWIRAKGRRLRMRLLGWR